MSNVDKPVRWSDAFRYQDRSPRWRLFALQGSFVIRSFPCRRRTIPFQPGSNDVVCLLFQFDRSFHPFLALPPKNEYVVLLLSVDGERPRRNISTGSGSGPSIRVRRFVKTFLVYFVDRNRYVLSRRPGHRPTPKLPDSDPDSFEIGGSPGKSGFFLSVRRSCIVDRSRRTGRRHHHHDQRHDDRFSIHPSSLLCMFV